MANILLHHAVGRMYIDATYPEGIHQKMLSMVKGIRKAFEHSINTNAWMDQETKYAIKKKVVILIFEH